MPRLVDHAHQPIYRVIRTSWGDSLDTSFSTTGENRRWNTPEFPALYCCCSEAVARAVALDLFRLNSVQVDDLQPGYRPQLAEINWSGERLADVASQDGVEAAGFPPGYPGGIDKAQTREAAKKWHASQIEGVVCRSASLWRTGFAQWEGDHEKWGEVAIFVENAKTIPKLKHRRTALDWLQAVPRAPEK